METRDFKKMFSEVSASHGFEAGGGGWYRALSTGTLALALQKSNFGPHFELNIKLFLHRAVPADTASLKKMITSMSGDIFRRQPEEYRLIFDLESDLTAANRKLALERFFAEFVDYVVAEAATPAGLRRLRDQGVIFLLPSVEARLNAG